jgi:hypothetical protein
LLAPGRRQLPRSVFRAAFVSHVARSDWPNAHSPRPFSGPMTKLENVDVACIRRMSCILHLHIRPLQEHNQRMQHCDVVNQVSEKPPQHGYSWPPKRPNLGRQAIERSSEIIKAFEWSTEGCKAEEKSVEYSNADLTSQPHKKTIRKFELPLHYCARRRTRRADAYSSPP